MQHVGKAGVRTRDGRFANRGLWFTDWVYKDGTDMAYAKFNSKGGINQPYILFKAKNMIDQQKRQLAWTKARPIAPGTKHPQKETPNSTSRTAGPHCGRLAAHLRGVAGHTREEEAQGMLSASTRSGR
jgi:hypothetical protein